MNNVKQFKKYCYEMSVTLPPPFAQIIVNDIIYLLHGKLKCHKNK